MRGPLVQGWMAWRTLSHYKRYTDKFEADSVPAEEIDEVARDVADRVLANAGTDRN